MRLSSGLVAASRAFADEAGSTDPEAPVHSEIWPTAARMIDHLGNVQAWATQIVRTGLPADRKAFRRPEGRDRVEWFSQTSSTLLEVLESTDPERECWSLFDAPSTAAFWGRRMTNEAAKHLWDLRTASDPAPPMPRELSLTLQADVIDEFVDVFVAAARTRGVDSLPQDVVLLAEDIDRGWRFSRGWHVSDAGDDTGDADILRASVGDLVLFVWQRASPWQQAGRYRIESAGEALQAFARTPIHL